MSKKLINHLKKVVKSTNGAREVRKEFIRRAEEGALARDENPFSHFCVYFAAYDPANRQVFIGHHKKSGLWLFNGGHLDQGELPEEALQREMKEEWGENVVVDTKLQPSLLSLTKIENPAKQICKLHYDIWYFIPLNKDTFTPDKTLLAKEFYQTGWKTMEEAKTLIKDANTRIALEKIKDLFNLVHQK